MSKKETLAFIHTLYRALRNAGVGNRGLFTDWQRYCRQIEESEKEHRKFAPAGNRFGISVSDTVALFAVQYLLEFRAGKFTYTDRKGREIEHKPRTRDVSDIFSTRLECFQAQALWEQNKVAIRKAISQSDARKFIAEVDYCELI